MSKYRKIPNSLSKIPKRFQIYRKKNPTQDSKASNPRPNRRRYKTPNRQVILEFPRRLGHLLGVTAMLIRRVCCPGFENNIHQIIIKYTFFDQKKVLFCRKLYFFCWSKCRFPQKRTFNHIINALPIPYCSPLRHTSAHECRIQVTFACLWRCMLLHHKCQESSPHLPTPASSTATQPYR